MRTVVGVARWIGSGARRLVQKISALAEGRGADSERGTTAHDQSRRLGTPDPLDAWNGWCRGSRG